MMSSQQIPHLQLAKKDAVIKQQFVEVILGRPSSNCKNFGICKIEGVQPDKVTTFNSNTACSNNRIYAFASLESKKRFELAFLKATLNTFVFNYHFGTNVFTVDEAYTVCKDLLGTPVTIEKGEYNIIDSAALLTVSFDLA